MGRAGIKWFDRPEIARRRHAARIRRFLNHTAKVEHLIGDLRPKPPVKLPSLKFLEKDIDP